MNGFGEPTDLAAMQQRLVDLQLQNEQLRSNSSRQHHQQQQTNNMLLGQLNSNQNEEFDWDKIMQGVNNQTTPQQNSNEIVIDRKKLAEYTSKVVEKTIDKKQQQYQQQLEVGRKTQETLQQRFVKEHPKLAQDYRAQELISRYWNRSLELNPNMDPEARYQGVLREASDTMSQFGYKPGEVDLNTPAYMSTGNSSHNVLQPGQRMQISREEQLGYNQNEHLKEMKERHQKVLDKFNR